MSFNAERREVYEQEIVRCLLGKMKLKDIATAVNLNVTTVRKYIKSDGFRALMQEKYPEIYASLDEALMEAADSITVMLEENSRKALERIAQLMDSDNDHIALKASQDALDRFRETSKVQKVEQDHHIKIDPTFLIHAAATAKEMEQFELRKALPLPEGSVQ